MTIACAKSYPISEFYALLIYKIGTLGILLSKSIILFRGEMSSRAETYAKD